MPVCQIEPVGIGFGSDLMSDVVMFSTLFGVDLPFQARNKSSSFISMWEHRLGKYTRVSGTEIGCSEWQVTRRLLHR